MRKFLGIFLLVLVFAAVVYMYNTVVEPENDGDEQPPEEVEETLDPMNILVLGLDSETGETGRTDTMIVMSYRPDREEVYLLSIPRDTRVQINGRTNKINAAFVFGGAELAVQTVEELLDITIDHHIVFNFEAFVTLIDLVEGIEVDVPIRMYYPAENIDLHPGVQVLDGEDALAYARYRGTSEGDLGRAKRQQEVIKLLSEKLFTPKMVVKIPQIIDTMNEYMQHDFSTTELLKFGTVAIRAKGKPMESLILPGESRLVNGIWYYLANEEKIPETAKHFQ